MGVRVVSMPSCELFRSQPREYRDALLPKEIPKMSVEMTTTFAWMEFVDACVGINSFGTSAPGSVCVKHFGFTVDNVVGCARRLLDGERGDFLVARPECNDWFAGIHTGCDCFPHLALP